MAVDDANLTPTQKFLLKAQKRLDRCVQAEEHDRELGVDDLKFSRGEPGDQWDGAAYAERVRDKRPVMQFDLLTENIDRMVGDGRINRVRIKVRPVDSKADVEIAKIRQGIIANIEYLSAADRIYDYALEMMARCGRGAWQVLTRYTEENPFLQEIYLERIKNPFQVYLDPDCKDECKADAKFGFLLEKIPKDEFEDRYPDAEVPGTEINAITGLSNQNWFDNDSITVADYYERVSETVRMAQLSDGRVMKHDDAKSAIKAYNDETAAITIGYQQTLAANPQAAASMPPPTRPELKIAKSRDTEEWGIRHWTITATEILSRDMSAGEKADRKDDGGKIKGERFPGKYIPLILATGPEFNVEGKPYTRSLIRTAKDPQKSYNYWCCLSLDTPLPTPSGWTTMREVKEGDMLLDEQGNPCTVEGISPVHEGRNCFRVTFDDGSFIIADDSHKWRVEERQKNDPIWKTRDICTSELVPRKHNIFSTLPLNLPDKDLPVHPYALGVWLGDGCRGSVRIAAGNEKRQALLNNFAALGISVSKVYMDNRNNGVGSFSLKGTTSSLRSIGVLNNKHIPADYLRASVEQRLQLLQGLMDTDGSIDKKFQCSFSTVFPQLASTFSELLRSLGIKAVCLFRKGRTTWFGPNVPNPDRWVTGADFYQFSFTCPKDLEVFRFPRKLEIQKSKTKFHFRRTGRYKIVDVSEVESVPVKCVKVSSPSCLFLAGESMVPTHNTAAAETIALAPKTPWVGTAKQFEGYENDYAQANVKNFPFLKYNVDDNEGEGYAGGAYVPPPPIRQQSVQPPVAMFQQSQNAKQAVQDALGMHGRDTGDVGPERTGAAMNAVQRPAEIGNFAFSDNLRRSIEHTGRVINSMIPDVLDSQRDIRIRNLDDTEYTVPINTTVSSAMKSMQSDPTRYKGMDLGKLRASAGTEDAKFNDITAGKYDIVSTTGPSYATQRVESAALMTQMAQYDPRIMQFGDDLVVKAMDFMFADELSDRLRRTLPPGLVPPKEGEAPMPPPPPSPDMIVAQEKMKSEQLKQQTERMKQQVTLMKIFKQTKETDTAIRKMILDTLEEVLVGDGGKQKGGGGGGMPTGTPPMAQPPGGMR